jgi:hypothetical protein
MCDWPKIQPDRQCADRHDYRDKYQDLNQHASDASHHHLPSLPFLALRNLLLRGWMSSGGGGVRNKTPPSIGHGWVYPSEVEADYDDHRQHRRYDQLTSPKPPPHRFLPF